MAAVETRLVQLGLGTVGRSEVGAPWALLHGHQGGP